jgi:dTDP-6-deoxy-L-talose 4-dehydrogenase (NAD+)
VKLLVTGATGFIGNHLINYLLKNKTKYHIIATSQNERKAKSFEWFNNVEYIQFDLNNIIEDNCNLYEKFYKPDVIIHLAWDNLSNYNDISHIENTLSKHFQFLKNLIQNGLKEVVVTGTCLEYGLQNGSLSENLETQPSNSYAIAKDSLRKFLIELKKNFNFNYKWIRLFYMYGEGQSEKSLISLLEKAVSNNEKVFNMSKGEQLRDYLYIKDIVKNIALILEQNKYTNEAINCSNGEPISIRSFVENYIKSKNYDLKLNFGYYDYPDYEPMAFWGDNNKLKNIKKELLLK